MIGWLKHLFESHGFKTLRDSRKDIHDNRNEMAKSISVAKQSGKKSYEALRVAENALKMLEKHQNGLKQ